MRTLAVRQVKAYHRGVGLLQMAASSLPLLKLMMLHSLRSIQAAKLIYLGQLLLWTEAQLSIWRKIRGNKDYPDYWNRGG
jgi:hypothetical protein